MFLQYYDLSYAKYLCMLHFFRSIITMFIYVIFDLLFSFMGHQPAYKYFSHFYVPYIDQSLHSYTCYTQFLHVLFFIWLTKG